MDKINYGNVNISDEEMTVVTFPANKPVKAKKPRKKKGLAKLTMSERESQCHTLRRMVNNYYDLERLYLSLLNRTKPKMLKADNETVKINLDPADIVTLTSQAKAIEGLMKGVMRGGENDGIIQTLRKMPFYQAYLKEFEGVGEIGAAIILSQFNIQHADTVSKMWAFAGLAPIPCRRCRICQNVVVETSKGYVHESYAKFRDKGQAKEVAAKSCPRPLLPEASTFASGKAMRPVEGVVKKNGEPGLNYNAWLRAKLVGAIGSAQITNRTKWREKYDEYKHRKQSQGWGVSDAHRHAAAIRYMVKLMLLEIWKAWREFEGLPVRPSYHEEKLGHIHSRQ